MKSLAFIVPFVAFACAMNIPRQNEALVIANGNLDSSPQGLHDLPLNLIMLLIEANKFAGCKLFAAVNLVAIHPQLAEYNAACKMIDQAEIMRSEDATENRSAVEIALEIPAIKCDPNMLPAFEVIVRGLNGEKEKAHVILFANAMMHKCEQLIDSILEKHSGPKLNNFLQSVLKSTSLPDYCPFLGSLNFHFSRNWNMF